MANLASCFARFCSPAVPARGRKTGCQNALAQPPSIPCACEKPQCYLLEFANSRSPSLLAIARLISLVEAAIPKCRESIVRQSCLPAIEQGFNHETLPNSRGDLPH